jgi:hypothetical protein
MSLKVAQMRPWPVHQGLRRGRRSQAELVSLCNIQHARTNWLIPLASLALPLSHCLSHSLTHARMHTHTRQYLPLSRVFVTKASARLHLPESHTCMHAHTQREKLFAYIHKPFADSWGLCTTLTYEDAYIALRGHRYISGYADTYKTVTYEDAYKVVPGHIYAYIMTGMPCTVQSFPIKIPNALLR